MVTIVFRTADGTETIAKTKSGYTLMEAAVNAGVEGVDAECGGGCACGTCHVQIDPARFGSFDPPDEAERDMLEMVQNRAPTSRLSCQVTLTEAHDNLVVTVPFPNGPA